MCGRNRKTEMKDAFTFMEVIIAIMISSILIPSLVIALGHTSKKGSETLSAYRDAVIADTILCRKADELMGIAYIDGRLNIATGAVFQTLEQDFTGIYAITYVDENLAQSETNTGYKKVILRVTTPRGREHVLNAYITAWK